MLRIYRETIEPEFETLQDTECMTHIPEIWKYLKSNLPKGHWISLEDIYHLIESNLSLDGEDFEWQSPSSNIPKRKRNVRNVLQYRKGTQEIEWDRHASYRP